LDIREKLKLKFMNDEGLYNPCEHLRKSKKNDAYYCSIYENRFGLHKTNVNLEENS
jgi:hypothetical protein